MFAFSKRLRILSLVGVLVGMNSAGFAADDAAAALPRYRLQVGHELTYKGRDEFKYTKGRFLTRSEWTFWVVRENPDHSWRIIVQSASSFKQIRNTDNALEALKNLGSLFTKEDDSDAQKQYKFAWFDIHPDGRIVDNPELGFFLQPSDVLVALPQSAAEVDKGWKSVDATQHSTNNYRQLPATNAKELVIDATQDSFDAKIYGIEQHRVVTFDRERGLPTKLTTETKQTYGFNGQGTGSMELADVKSHSAEWAETMRVESEKCLANMTVHYQTTRRKDLSVDDFKNELLRLNKEFQELIDKLQTPELKLVAGEQSKLRETNQKYYVDSLEELKAVLDKPSEDWKTTDLDGKDRSLQDYRGQVVVLDFWYRGCGWCVRSMPQMKEVATHFKGQPVSVLGMNTDRKLEDAKFVVDEMGLNYTNLKAEGLPEKYKVSGFPTLLILDQKGVVRDVHVGYSPTLKEEVVKSIEEILKKPQ